MGIRDLEEVGWSAYIVFCELGLHGRRLDCNGRDWALLMWIWLQVEGITLYMVIGKRKAAYGLCYAWSGNGLQLVVTLDIRQERQSRITSILVVSSYNMNVESVLFALLSFLFLLWMLDG